MLPPHGVKHGDILSLLLFNCTLEYVTREVQENQEEQVSSLDQVLVYAYDFNLVGKEYKYCKDKDWLVI
jgi:hypothetical protein